MCGRYTLALDPTKLERLYKIKHPSAFDWMPRYNISPQQMVPVVLQEGPWRKLTLMQWGLVIPAVTDDKNRPRSLMNVRADTLLQRRTFQNLLLTRRCLVPAQSFFEWREGTRQQAPLKVAVTQEDVFSMAGVWNEWQTPEGRWVKTVAVVTTDANNLLRPIHPRMPVILTKEGVDLWLNPQTKIEDLKLCMGPFPESGLELVEVSSYVNSPHNEGSRCIEQEQLSLFI